MHSRSNGWIAIFVLSLLALPVASRAEAPSPSTGEGIDWAKAKEFWSFRAPASHLPPIVREVAWPRQPIDFFVLARLEQAGVSPSPGSGRRELIRRMTFDLTGLPPTPEDVDAFVKDESTGAY